MSVNITLVSANFKCKGLSKGVLTRRIARLSKLPGFPAFSDNLLLQSEACQQALAQSPRAPQATLGQSGRLPGDCRPGRSRRGAGTIYRWSACGSARPASHLVQPQPIDLREGLHGRIVAVEVADGSRDHRQESGLGGLFI